MKENSNNWCRADRSEDPCWDIDLDEAGKEAAIPGNVPYQRIHQWLVPRLGRALTFSSKSLKSCSCTAHDVLWIRYCLNKTKSSTVATNKEPKGAVRPS